MMAYRRRPVVVQVSLGAPNPMSRMGKKRDLRSSLDHGRVYRFYACHRRHR